MLKPDPDHILFYTIRLFSHASVRCRDERVALLRHIDDDAYNNNDEDKKRNDQVTTTCLNINSDKRCFSAMQSTNLFFFFILQGH